MVLTAFTWSCCIGACARDAALLVTLLALALGSTIALGSWFQYGDDGIRAGIKAAGYFFIISAVAAWYRVTVYSRLLLAVGRAPLALTTCLRLISRRRSFRLRCLQAESVRALQSGEEFTTVCHGTWRARRQALHASADVSIKIVLQRQRHIFQPLKKAFNREIKIKSAHGDRKTVEPVPDWRMGTMLDGRRRKDLN